MSLQFAIDLSSDVAAAVSRMEDDVVALLALDANSRGHFPPNALDVTRWAQLVALPGALEDEHWLLSYEANGHGWLVCAAVATHSFFGVLQQNGVRFYDPTQRLTNFTGPAAAVPGGGLGPGYA